MLKSKIHIGYLLLALLLIVSVRSAAQSVYGIHQTTGRFSQVSGTSYDCSTTPLGASTPFGNSPQSGIFGNPSEKFGGQSRMGLTSRHSRFDGFMGVTAEETRRNMNRRFMLFGEEEEEEDGNPDVPIFNGEDDEKVPLGDPIVPLLLMLAVYAVWKQRKTHASRSTSK